jgi:hypothetical protein
MEALQIVLLSTPVSTEKNPDTVADVYDLSCLRFIAIALLPFPYSAIISASFIIMQCVQSPDPGLKSTLSIGHGEPGDAASKLAHAHLTRSRRSCSIVHQR